MCSTSMPAAVGGGGDGTESSPWWGLATAVEQLTDLHHDRPASIFSDGQVVRLTHREVFTATPLERRKKVKESHRPLVFMMTALAC